MRKQKTLEDFKKGEWFYTVSGELQQLVEKDEDGWCEYTNGLIRSSSSAKNTVAYELTIHNKVIADNVQWYFREFSKNNLLTPKTSHRLEEYCMRLMDVDETADQQEYTKIWSEMDMYTHDLKEHMSHFR